MAYSREQLSQIVEDYWSVGSVRCPEDDSIINIKRSPHAQGYNLIGRCLRCGQAVKATNHDDPIKAEFRRWTAEELTEMAEDFYESRSALCPVCEVDLEVKPLATHMKPPRLMFHCKRCLHHATYSPGPVGQSEAAQNT